MDGVYYAKAAAYMAAAFTMGLGSIGPALAQGMIAKSGCENIGKYPESAGKISGAMFLSVAIVEAVAVYCLLISGALIAVGYMLEVPIIR